MGLGRRWVWLGLLLICGVLSGGCKEAAGVERDAAKALSAALDRAEVPRENGKAAEILGLEYAEALEGDVEGMQPEQRKASQTQVPEVQKMSEPTQVPEDKEGLSRREVMQGQGESKQVQEILEQTQVPEDKEGLSRREVTQEQGESKQMQEILEQTQVSEGEGELSRAPVSKEQNTPSQTQSGQPKVSEESLQEQLPTEEPQRACAEHDFTKSIWELPTCQKGGYYNNVCKRCGLVECVTQNPLPHQVEDRIIQEGNCMEDTIIRHICKQCGLQVESDTRFTAYDAHSWVTESVDGGEVTYCEWCGVAR